MGIKNYFYQYKPLNDSGKENAKVPVLALCQNMNGERAERRQKSRKREKKEQYQEKKQQ